MGKDYDVIDARRKQNEVYSEQQRRMLWQESCQQPDHEGNYGEIYCQQCDGKHPVGKRFAQVKKRDLSKHSVQQHPEHGGDQKFQTGPKVGTPLPESRSEGQCQAIQPDLSLLQLL